MVLCPTMMTIARWRCRGAIGHAITCVRPWCVLSFNDLAFLISRFLAGIILSSCCPANQNPLSISLLKDHFATFRIPGQLCKSRFGPCDGALYVLNYHLSSVTRNTNVF